MYGLTLTLPYPYLIAAAAARPELGKQWETRSWAPWPRDWRGEIAIHAAKNLTPVGGKRGLRALVNEPPFFYALVDTVEHDIHTSLVDKILSSLGTGVIVAVAQLADVGTARRGYDDASREVPVVVWSDKRIEVVPEPERSFGDYAPGRRIWRLAEIRALAEPVPCRGRQGLWTVPTGVQAAIRAQLEATHA